MRLPFDMAGSAEPDSVACVLSAHNTYLSDTARLAGQSKVMGPET